MIYLVFPLVNFILLVSLLLLADKMIKEKRNRESLIKKVVIIFFISLYLWYTFPQTLIAPLAVIAMGGWIWIHDKNKFLHMGLYSGQLIKLMLTQFGLTIYLSLIMLSAGKYLLLFFIVIVLSGEFIIFLVSVIMIPIIFIIEKMEYRASMKRQKSYQKFLERSENFRDFSHETPRETWLRERKESREG